MIKKLLVILAIVIFYLGLINLIAKFVTIPNFKNIEGNKLSVETTVIGIHDSVSVSVKKPRWYGTIYQKDFKSDLELFGFIPLPLKAKNINYLYFHLPFIICLFILIQLKGGTEKHEKYILDNSTNDSIDKSELYSWE